MAVAAEKEFTNSLGMKFVLVPAGTFTMGSPPDEPGRSKNEVRHQVRISKSFYMQTTPVTQGAWKKVMGYNPSYRRCGDDCPVDQVSWNDVQEFIVKLNSMEGTNRYRLPTEAEWEYAARLEHKQRLRMEALKKRNAVMTLTWIVWAGTVGTQGQRCTLLLRSSPTPGVSTICTETSMNGCRIGTEITQLGM